MRIWPRRDATSSDQQICFEVSYRVSLNPVVIASQKFKGDTICTK